MPPRYSYWTILAGGLPTAFRAAERDDLLPTFNRILEKHPDAEMKWFARGKLWDSPDAAREETEARRRPPDSRPEGRPEGRRPDFARPESRGSRPPRKPDDRRGPPPARTDDDRGARPLSRPPERPDDRGAPPSSRPPGGSAVRKDRNWRPGGEHRDPRQKFKDAKKLQNQDRRQERFDRKNRPPREKPHGDPLRPEVPPWRDRPGPPAARKPAPRPFGRGPQVPRGGGTGKPPFSGPPRQGPPRDRDARPKGPPRDRDDRPPRGRADRPSGPPRERSERPSGPPRGRVDRPSGPPRERSERPPGPPRGRDDRPRPPDRRRR